MPGEVFERAADGDLGFDGLELALELLNLAQALGNDLGVLLVELFQAVRLGLVVLQVGFQRGEFLGVMGAVGLVIGGRGRLQQALQLLALALLALDLVPEQGDLPGQLAVGIMRLVGLGFGIADAALDHGLVDGIGFGGLLRHQAHPYKQPLDRSEHRFSFCGLLVYCFFTGSSSSRRILRWRMILQLGIELLLIRGADHRRAELLDRIKDLGIHVKGDEMHGHAGLLLLAPAA